MRGRRLVVGDIHGSYKALMQVLERAHFNMEEDHLYFTGDIADGYRQVYECIGFLRKLPHFHPVIGNHDIWLQNYLATDTFPADWTMLGGRASIMNFNRLGITIEERREMAKYLSSWPYVVEEDDFFLMHGGPGDLSDKELSRLARQKRNIVDPNGDIWEEEAGDEWTVLWDRTAYESSRSLTAKRVIIGHTEIENHKPFVSQDHKIINVDTACGSYGCLTVMDLDTLEYWQSDDSQDLYGYCSIQY